MSNINWALWASGATDCLTVLMTLPSVSLLILYHVSYSMSNVISLPHFLQQLGMVAEC